MSCFNACVCCCISQPDRPLPESVEGDLSDEVDLHLISARQGVGAWQCGGLGDQKGNGGDKYNVCDFEMGVALKPDPWGNGNAFMRADGKFKDSVWNFTCNCNPPKIPEEAKGAKSAEKRGEWTEKRGESSEKRGKSSEKRGESTEKRGESTEKRGESREGVRVEGRKTEGRVERARGAVILSDWADAGGDDGACAGARGGAGAGDGVAACAPAGGGVGGDCRDARGALLGGGRPGSAAAR